MAVLASLGPGLPFELVPGQSLPVRSRGGALDEDVMLALHRRVTMMMVSALMP